MIRDEIRILVKQALTNAQTAGDIPQFVAPEVTIEHPQRAAHGDFSANLPLRIQGLAKMKAIEVAQALRVHAPKHEAISEITVAPPGFLNLYLDSKWVTDQLAMIIDADSDYAATERFAGQRVQIEYVSANPTGPIHVGNGRGAAIGSTLANVMRSAGYEVEQEYYVNDAGTQVSIFGRTLYARYQQLFERDVDIPENGYPGEYMVSIAKAVKEAHGDTFLRSENEEPKPEFAQIGIEIQIANIRNDLKLMGVEYDEWFSERSLMIEDGPYDDIMQLLRDQNFVAERDGAVWFTSTEVGESKDNVLIRSDGAPTYYATDIAYHYDKFIIRNFDRVIDIWGADHQGHVSRVKAGVAAVGGEPDQLDIMLYQLVTLKRQGEVVMLSKRAGEIITLSDLIDEVGVDATRFFFLSPSANQAMDFDLDLAKKQSDENPVYYVQYAHARIAGIIAKAREEGKSSDGADPSLLSHEAEQTLIRKLLQLPEILETVIDDLAPHHLAHYAQELAQVFHTFYTQCRVINDDESLTKARLLLLEAARIVLARTLTLMGISTPDQM